MLDDILKTTVRLPFTDQELKIFIDATKRRHSNGHDLRFGDGVLLTDKNEFLAATKDGLCFSFSPKQLEVRFLFVKCDGGKGLWGGQKAVYNSYLQHFHEDTWAIGAVFKLWAIAATSIGNVYRGNNF